jgi:multiple sugar transport system ATP-binding protein
VVQLGALALPAPAAERLVLGIRGEDLEECAPEAGFPFTVQVAEPMGSHNLLTGTAFEHRLRVLAPADRECRPGEVIHLRPLAGRIRWMDAASGEALGA